VFGYVNIYKDELKVKDYNKYRSFYCGLCKTLGREFSLKTRLTLNYDFAFLALILSSLKDGKMEVQRERCIIHPFNKTFVLKHDKYLLYSAYMSVITTYFKLKDDVNDNKNLKSLLSFLIFYGHIKKAKKKYPCEYEKIKFYLDALCKLEKEKSGDIDEVAHNFGELLKTLFMHYSLEYSDSVKRALEQFSYQLGRYIYIIDALDDIEKDIKNKNYNPFLIRYSYNVEDAKTFKEKVSNEYDLIVTLTLESIASAFELLDFKKNRDTVENIVYLGLRKTKDRVLKGEK